ncbi:hypothetical protein RJ640_023363 [Escallonia rubra]|uniref:Uncharacterized protein n=1 Tax=Escallonia rubra TaxID=112253 RepID=A0AA88RBS3_9ASTE|nr:hypothetical protein RJ640_023363 [Escallonia rubra]
MTNPDNERFEDTDESIDDRGTNESSSSREISENSGDSRQGGEAGLTERLTDILVDDGDGDLLFEREDGVLQWLQALDMQVMGACRTAERLKPLLKLNQTSGAAEDRLLAHLTQHFEPSEVGLLARCLCIPLVSIRVGKIDKQGSLLCPSSTRGSLTLTLLPTSDLRLSFIGDDGHSERLLTLSRVSDCSSVAIEEIPADRSGRSFLMKIPGSENIYFWCSETSKLLGEELLGKMKDLLQRKPSVAELTGISESRLDCFATFLRAYLVGSAVTKTRGSPLGSMAFSLDTSVDSAELCQNALLVSSSPKPSRPRHYGSIGAKPNSFIQGSLSPRTSSFKEGLPRNLSSMRSIGRDKYKRSQLSCVDNLSVALPNTMDAFSSNQAQQGELPESLGTCLFPPSSFIESLGKSADQPILSPASQVPSTGGSFFSPYYCWCPPVSSTLQYTAPPQLPISSSTESSSLPPLSSLLSTTKSSSVLAPFPPINLSELPSMDFPPFLPEPLIRLPLSMSTSQQIPTFTPLMCDSIIHIPVMDVCSSGQGYLVSAGPGISTTLPSLHSTLVNPLISKSDAAVENGARETLRLLLSNSNQANPQLMTVFPSVLANCDENILVAGSRGLYSGVSDVGAIASSIAAMGLVSLSEGSEEVGVTSRRIRRGDLLDRLEKPSGSNGPCSEDEGSLFSGHD